MHRLSFLLGLLALIFPALSADPRVALSVGINRYENFPTLKSPVNDAHDVAAALEAAGYPLVGGKALVDATFEQFISAAEDFATKARGAEAAVFDFSGHGLGVGSDQYLVPGDTPALTGILAMGNSTVLLRERNMVALEKAEVIHKVVILDCCRDNPFEAELKAAIEQVEKSTGSRPIGPMFDHGVGEGLRCGDCFATATRKVTKTGDRRRGFLLSTWRP